MNPALLLNHFERISEAPAAIPRLRTFILDLAVRGKLVEQDSQEEQSPELCELRNQDSAGTPELQPVSWVRAKISKLLNFQYGKALPMSVVCGNGPVRIFGSNGVVGHSSEALTEDPAIIIGRKGSAGALNLCDGPSWTKDVAYFIVPPAFFDIRYLYFALQTLNLDQLGKGVKPGLSRSDAYQLELSVPPLCEQHRIVAKVNELMSLCDRLETIQRERETRRDRLTSASHHHLNNGAHTEAFREQAGFCLGHLPRVTSRPDQIKQLRHTVLNLAVRGRLALQDPNDEPASELLKSIQAEKMRLMKEGIIKKVDSIDPSQGPAFPFPLPSGWSRSNLQSLCISVTDGDHLPPPKADHGIPFLVIGNVRNQTISFTGCRHVSEEYYNALDAIRRPRRGDILYTLVGSYGIPIIIRDDRPFCVQRHIGILRPSGTISVAFLSRVLESKWVFDQASACSTGIAQKTVPLAGLRRILIPLPPLAEQHRIVARVDELMSLCDRLEAQLTTAQAESSLLLEAVLHHALHDTSLHDALVPPLVSNDDAGLLESK